MSDNTDTKTVGRPSDPEKDPEAKSGTDQFPRVERGSRAFKLSLWIGILAIAIIIILWVLHEWLGFWLISIHMKYDFADEQCEWTVDNLPLWLIGEGVLKAEDSSSYLLTKVIHRELDSVLKEPYWKKYLHEHNIWHKYPYMTGTVQNVISVGGSKMQIIILDSKEVGNPTGHDTLVFLRKGKKLVDAVTCSSYSRTALHKIALEDVNQDRYKDLTFPCHEGWWGLIDERVITKSGKNWLGVYGIYDDGFRPIFVKKAKK